MVARPARSAPPPAAAARADLDGPLLGLPGVAERRAELYAAAGLRTRRQLLYHLPVRWRLRPPAGAADALRPGEVGAVVGRVSAARCGDAAGAARSRSSCAARAAAS
jgi:hypothetical protein